jgi:predicted secreted protein
MFGEYTIWYILMNFVIMLFGVGAHFAKKKIKGETLADIKTYFKTHFKSTITTMIAAIVAFGSLVATGGLGWIASFSVGFAADSLFNKSAK